MLSDEKKSSGMARPQADMRLWYALLAFQQIVLVGLLSNAYFTWGTDAKVQADMLEIKNSYIARLEVLDTRRDGINNKLEQLEMKSIKHESRLEVLEQGTASHKFQTTETLRSMSRAVADVQQQQQHTQEHRPAAPAMHEARRLAEQNQDRATIRVNAPNGVSEFIMGEKEAADNVVMEKEHGNDGGVFTFKRNQTKVFDVAVDGEFSVHSTTMNVKSMVRTVGSPLRLQGRGGVNIESTQDLAIEEVDGQGTWSKGSVTIYTGDIVTWTWTNYHNVIQTDPDGGIKYGGVTSGTPALGGTFSHAFTHAGTYLFKSQTQHTMTLVVEVLDSFLLHNGTLSLGGDLEVGGTIKAGKIETNGVPAGYEQEIKMFLGAECPMGWTEATELGGYFLMGRPTDGGVVNQTMNRPMNATEEGRMHSTYYKGNKAFSESYDDRYFGGYYTSFGSSSTGYRCQGPSCGYCRLPGSNSNLNCDTHFGGHYQLQDWFYSHNSNRYYRWDKLTNPAYQTPMYMGHIGEYYPFATILICKRA